VSNNGLAAVNITTDSDSGVEQLISRFPNVRRNFAETPSSSMVALWQQFLFQKESTMSDEMILAYSDWDENEATPHSCPTLCEV